MASSEVDQKFLGKLAQAVEKENKLLGSMLFKILGLSINLSQLLVTERRQRRHDRARSTPSLELYFHIIWLTREGSVMLEQYVLPMVGNYVELKVLAYKMRASFYHIIVLFHNDPPVSTLTQSAPLDAEASPSPAAPAPLRVDKGKGIARDDDPETVVGSSSSQPNHAAEGGPVGPPPGFGPARHADAAAFLYPVKDYLPLAHQYFRDAATVADELLWGSHSLRLSVKTEYAAFLFDCVHDADGSRKLAKDTIAEVYEATEGIDNDMFNDACALVTVLGRMMKRGLGTNNGGPRSKSRASGSGTETNTAAEAGTRTPGPTKTEVNMPDFI